MSNIVGEIGGVRDTLSSWDNCMSKAYCKWPVIVGIIIGSLIVLSVLFCVVQILCSGAKCCFCCASIAKCLCCGCCRSGGGGGHRHEKNSGGGGGDSGGGWNHALNYNGNSGIKNNGYAQPQSCQPQYSSHAPPQYSTATFVTPSSRTAAPGPAAGNADALPAMPSWNDAKSRRVEDHTEQDLEMGAVTHNTAAEPMLPKFESDDYKYAQQHPGAAEPTTPGGSAHPRPGAGYARQLSYESGYTSNYTRNTTVAEPAYDHRATSPYDSRGYQNGPRASPYGAQDAAYDVDPYTQGSYSNERPHATTQTSYGRPEYGRHQSASEQHSPARNGFGLMPDAQHGSGGAGRYAAYGGQSSSSNYAPREDTMRSNTGRGGMGRKPVQGSWRDL